MKTFISFSSILFLSFFLLLSICSKAQNGSLDLGFGNSGIATSDFGNSESANSVAVQNDGKIVVGGTVLIGAAQKFGIARYNTNGTPDNSFGTNGQVVTDIDTLGDCVCVKVLSNGKILALGRGMHDFILVRYLSNGSKDSTFGINGIVIADNPNIVAFVYDMAIQNDGKIVIAGSHHNGGSNYDALVFRLNVDATMDTTFGNAGMHLLQLGLDVDEALSVKLQNDGKIVLGGIVGTGNDRDFLLIRLKINGSLDSTFGNNGMQITAIGPVYDICRTVCIQNDGKILASGYTYYNLPNARDLVIVRYNANGSLDNTFGTGGISVVMTDSIDYGSTAGVLPDGKIVVGGTRKTATAYDFLLTCFNSTGQLEATFGNGGATTTDYMGSNAANSLAVQNDGRIVVAGITNNNGAGNDFMVTRYVYDLPSPEGINDNEYFKSELLCYPNPFYTYTVLQSHLQLYDAVLFLYDACGLPVKQLNHLYGREIKFERENLPAGIYTIQLKHGTKTISRNKVIVID